MAERPEEPQTELLRDYADYEAERHRLGERLAGRLGDELASKPIPTRRSPMRLLYVTFPLAAAALAGAALVSSLVGPREEAPAEPPPVAEVTPQVAPAQGLTVRASLDQGALLLGSGADRFLVVEFEAGSAAVRGPVHLAAVVDTSGSMAGDRKIAYARQALLALASQLGPEDTLAIVGFDSDARVWLPSGPVDEPRVFEAVSALVPRGGTRIGAGLALGLAELSRVEGRGARRVVVLSDGISDEDLGSLATRAGSQVEQGVTVSALGLGLDFDSRALMAVSDAGGGSYRYVDRPEGLAALFEEELGTMTRLASRGVSLQVQLAPGVEVRQVYGYGEHDGEVTAQGYRALIGDMHAQQQRKVVARLHVPDGVAGDRPVASVTVGYTPPGGDRQTIALDVRARVTSDPQEVAASFQPRAGLLAARAIQGDTLQRSHDGWSLGDRDAAARAWREGDAALLHLQGYLQEDVAELRTQLEDDARALETLELGTRASRVRELRMQVEAAAAME
jgi:Mg-chelatase subunit ChlD